MTLLRPTQLQLILDNISTKLCSQLIHPLKINPLYTNSTRLKYIMLLKLPIILSRDSFNFYTKLFPTFYYKSMQMCYKNHNISLIKQKHTIFILICHLIAECLSIRHMILRGEGCLLLSMCYVYICIFIYLFIFN